MPRRNNIPIRATVKAHSSAAKRLVGVKSHPAGSPDYVGRTDAKNITSPTYNSASRPITKQAPTVEVIRRISRRAALKRCDADAPHNPHTRAMSVAG